MPINLSQYRGVVGAFNSQFIHIKRYDIFKNPYSQSKMKQTIANEIFTVFTSLLMFLLIASKQIQIYQFAICQDFLYLCSINIHTPYLVIFDHIQSKWRY